MPLVISDNLVLSAEDVGTDRPLIGWPSIVTTTNIAADTEDPNYPVTNLANPATHLAWHAADATEQYVTVAPGGADDIDFVGIARHNLGSASIPVSIEGDDGGGFDELTAPVLLGNDRPAMFLFTRQPFAGVRIRLQSGDDPATIAVVYVGKLIHLERKVWVGHTPLPFGRTSKITNGKSEAGNFLGRIVTEEFVQSRLPLSLIDPDWYRAHLDDFIAASKEDPFFICARPDTYPDEVGYAFITNDPMPVPEGPHNLYALTLELNGVV